MIIFDSRYTTCMILFTIRIVCVLLLTFTITYWYIFRRNNVLARERFESPFDGIVFMNKKDFLDVALASSFFKGMTTYDMIARKLPGVKPSEYIKRYVSSIEEFSSNEMTVLGEALQIAKAQLTKYPGLLPNPWKLVKVNMETENGYPHTLGDVIVVSDALLLSSTASEIAKTLTHEAIHVLQRKKPSLFRSLIIELGFRTVTDSELHRVHPNVLELLRGNPDLDNNMYMHIESSLVLGRIYKSTNPSSLADSHDVMISLEQDIQPVHAENKAIGLPASIYCQLEHPYEIVACLISDILSNDAFEVEQNTNIYVKNILKWLKSNF
jgi:hypothetical protein